MYPFNTRYASWYGLAKTKLNFLLFYLCVKVSWSEVYFSNHFLHCMTSFTRIRPLCKPLCMVTPLERRDKALIHFLTFLLLRWSFLIVSIFFNENCKRRHFHSMKNVTSIKPVCIVTHHEGRNLDSFPYFSTFAFKSLVFF